MSIPLLTDSSIGRREKAQIHKVGMWEMPSTQWTAPYWLRVPLPSRPLSSQKKLWANTMICLSANDQQREGRKQWSRVRKLQLSVNHYWCIDPADQRANCFIRLYLIYYCPWLCFLCVCVSKGMSVCMCECVCVLTVFLAGMEVLLMHVWPGQIFSLCREMLLLFISATKDVLIIQAPHS